MGLNLVEAVKNRDAQAFIDYAHQNELILMPGHTGSGCVHCARSLVYHSVYGPKIVNGQWRYDIYETEVPDITQDELQELEEGFEGELFSTDLAKFGAKIAELADKVF